MNLPKSLLILTVFLVAACKKERPKQVWIYDDHEITMLNGNVKQISISYNSQPADFFHRIFFDEKGNLIYSEKRTLDVAQMGHETDSTIATENIEYSVQTNTSKIALIGSYSGDNYNMDKSTSKYAHISKWEFDKTGRAINYIPDINGPSSDIGRYKYNVAADLIEYKQNYSRFADRDLYKYKYNQNHRMIESDFYDGDKLLLITSFQYKSFDSNKNWTIRISHSHGHGPWGDWGYTDTVTRKITYY